jgi:hypothetical protein
MTKAPLALLVMGKTLYRKDLRLKNQFVEHMVVTEGGGDGIVNKNRWKGTKVGNNAQSFYEDFTWNVHYISSILIYQHEVFFCKSVIYLRRMSRVKIEIRNGEILWICNCNNNLVYEN